MIYFFSWKILRYVVFCETAQKISDHIINTNYPLFVKFEKVMLEKMEEQ